jgi:hypothetical protein
VVKRGRGLDCRSEKRGEGLTLVVERGEKVKMSWLKMGRGLNCHGEKGAEG